MREKIIQATIEEFSRVGLKLTMDDIAKNLSMSKKTLYTYYSGKEELMMAVVDFCFSDIKRSEQAILMDTEMDIVDKIRNIIVVLPERYTNIGLSGLAQLKEKMPKVYAHLEHYLQTDWDATITLIESGMAQGRIKNVSIPVLKAMIEATIESFFQSTVLVDNGLSYEAGLDQMIDIIVNGIVVNKQEELE